MLRFVADHIKTKGTCKHAVKNVPWIIRHNPDQLTTKEMCHKAILENGGTLKLVREWWKFLRMCIKLFIVMHMH